MIIDIAKTAKFSAHSHINSDANVSATKKTSNLVGNLLLAAPLLQDSAFARAVIYLCVHDEGGAMGIVINYPIKNLVIDDIMEQLNINGEFCPNMPVHFGGPVDGHRGFILHSDDFMAGGAIFRGNGLAITSNADVLKALAEGAGPRHGLLAIGYSGWGAGQLEAEIENGSWIVAPANHQLIFETKNDLKWNMGISSLGFDVGNFSSTVGHA